MTLTYATVSWGHSDDLEHGFTVIRSLVSLALVAVRFNSSRDRGKSRARKAPKIAPGGQPSFLVGGFVLLVFLDGPEDVREQIIHVA